MKPRSGARGSAAPWRERELGGLLTRGYRVTVTATAPLFSLLFSLLNTDLFVEQISWDLTAEVRRTGRQQPHSSRYSSRVNPSNLF